MQTTSITLTDKQNQLKNEGIKWYNSRSDKKYFTILGLAGTGKSTIVKYMVDEIGIPESRIAFATYTGMAASVLMRKGIKTATTIHRLIYDVKFYKLPGGKKHFEFNLKDRQEIVDQYDLIVIDEVSMVPDNMIKELLSFNIKILFIGDHGQLDPIYGKNTIVSEPDGFLEEIHRQALDSPIITLAMKARNNEMIRCGQYGDNVFVMRKNEVDHDMLYYADQIIAGKNKTIDELNHHIRRNIIGFESDSIQPGDKVICTANDWDKSITSDNGQEAFLVNGTIGFANDIKHNSRNYLYNMSFSPIFIEGDEFKNLYVDSLPFIEHLLTEPVNEKSLFIQRKAIDEKYGIQEFKYGYAISCHKSQGSEFNDLVVYNEVLNRNTHNKWLYTAITRAKDNLILLL